MMSCCCSFCTLAFMILAHSHARIFFFFLCLFFSFLLRSSDSDRL
ncbi:hypothetical protein I7I50_00708 [Histoplasma capsulatum G186AR]|uniref:Uncharacterized protein n=1 Tax=Ajellomyces capsulatus TaxID=5037 RepID=A0A8H8CV06_AJECA|nr:hypothetical protein I7I52_07976 [Histoplasma capsulatum]QSS72764.1 hypothetical protein I7I50_00708 [Histoplasma capsulatum G186AR]